MTDPSPAAVALSKAREALEPFARRHFDMDAPSDTPRLIKVTVANLKKASEAVTALAELAAVPVDVETRARELLKDEYADMPYVAEGIGEGVIGSREIRAIIKALSTPATPTAIQDGRDAALEEALKAVDCFVDSAPKNDWDAGYNGACSDIAAAIRALRSSGAGG